MKINQFLKQARKCKSRSDVRDLYEIFEREFCDSVEFEKHQVFNKDFEANPATFSLDLNVKLSNMFSISVQPRLDNLDLKISVSVIYMKDGQGEMSRNFEVFHEMLDDVEFDQTMIFAEVATLAKETVEKMHAELLEMMGMTAQQGKDLIRQKFFGALH
ncbi:hypothetical protein QN372_19275 [Undibacterium sp. RTI2.1]|uniref:hypothetical protein n=1 Tax=unclassified Undibacterium TaxID=2630295 RepID=UPI002B22F1A7|nr:MULTISPECIES: hypothetical protein [unclassified Undibacterium]MEB0032895.1 hypothetical protein [Undibacterium sp. RTI2.1]MEB0118800.1 hypothetical protein [Undibacterium sp. RTI2.2]